MTTPRPFSLQIELPSGALVQGSTWETLDGAQAQADGLLNSGPEVCTIAIYQQLPRRKTRKLIQVRDRRDAAVV